MRILATQSNAPLRSRRRRRVALLLISIPAAASALAFTLDLRINLTPSEPLGIWRIHPLVRPVRVGDLVFVCPPQTADMAEARGRGYLRAGLCPGGYAPLIKAIAATSGQRIDIGRHVHIDGRELPHSSLASKDGKGRILSPFAGGTVPVGQVFIHSSFAGSFDSRYFGPVPASGILGFASEVLTYVP